jgi:choline kinase
MKAIILAAGMGTRLKPLTYLIPKCLAEVNGKIILENMLEILERIKVDETIIVVGYRSAQIINKFGTQINKMKIAYVSNNNFEHTNTSYSLLIGLNKTVIDDCTLILEGDIFFEQKLIETFVNDKNSLGTIIDVYNPDLDGSFVDVDCNFIVLDWIHTNRRKNDFVIEKHYKTVNVHKLNKEFLTDILYPVLERSIIEKKGVEPLEYIFQDIILSTNVKIKGCLAYPFKWCEIDTVKDLDVAEKIFAF